MLDSIGIAQQYSCTLLTSPVGSNLPRHERILAELDRMGVPSPSAPPPGLVSRAPQAHAQDMHISHAEDGFEDKDGAGLFGPVQCLPLLLQQASFLLSALRFPLSAFCFLALCSPLSAFRPLPPSACSSMPQVMPLVTALKHSCDLNALSFVAGRIRTLPRVRVTALSWASLQLPALMVRPTARPRLLDAGTC